MQLAGRIYDVVMRDENLSDIVREVVPASRRKREYWRSALRMAALCHDLGHLPFSHAAEKELLPVGVGHEQITRALIESDLMEAVWDGIRPRPEPEDVVKLALGPKEAQDLTFDTWEAILAEMIVGDVFGADRIDYLLRDSLHTGVAYASTTTALSRPCESSRRRPTQPAAARRRARKQRARRLASSAAGSNPPRAC